VRGEGGGGVGGGGGGGGGGGVGGGGGGGFGGGKGGNLGGRGGAGGGGGGGVEGGGEKGVTLRAVRLAARGAGWGGGEKFLWRAKNKKNAGTARVELIYRHQTRRAVRVWGECGGYMLTRNVIRSTRSWQRRCGNWGGGWIYGGRQGGREEERGGGFKGRKVESPGQAMLPPWQEAKAEYSNMQGGGKLRVGCSDERTRAFNEKYSAQATFK